MKLNQNKITKAWFFASRVHKEQLYPGEELPYLTHIGNVMIEVMAVANRLDNPELAVICAILHDTIEDTEVSYELVKKEFGVSVANGVLALSKDEILGSKEEKMMDSLKRIKQEPKEIWVVKMADRISNLGKPPKHWENWKIEAYKKEAEIILDAFAEADDMVAMRLKEKIEAYTKWYRND